MHHQRGVGWGGDPTGGKVDHRQAAQLGRLLDQVKWGLDILGIGVKFILIHALQAADFTHHRARVADSFDHIAGARFALGADHRGTLGDTTQRLAQVATATDKGHGKFVLVNVVIFVGGGEHFALINIIDPERLQNLRFDKVADARLGHHRDCHCGNDALDHIGVTHARHTTIATDVSRHPFQRHHRTRAGLFGNARLLRCHHIHDHAALEHLRQAGFHRKGAGLRAAAICIPIATVHHLLHSLPYSSTIILRSEGDPAFSRWSKCRISFQPQYNNFA